MVPAGMQFLIVILFSYLGQKKNKHWYTIFIFPGLMCLTEWLLSFTNIGTYQTIAYNQLLWAPVVQVAALGGYLAVTFILSLFASTVAYVVINYKQYQKIAIASIIAVSIFLLGYFMEYGVLKICQRKLM